MRFPYRRVSAATCLALHAPPSYLVHNLFAVNAYVASVLNDRTLTRFLDKYSHVAKNPVAVFDCDDTLIKGDIGEAMLYFQLEHFLLRISPGTLWSDHPKREELNNLYEGLSHLPADKAVHDRRFVSFSEMILDWYFDQLTDGRTEKACSDIVRLFAGFTRSEVRQIAEATVKRELESPLQRTIIGHHDLPRGIRFIRQAIDLLELLRSKEFDIWTVSGSNQWSVEAVCERIGIRNDKVIGIELQEDDGVLTPVVRHPVPVLEGKVKALKTRTAATPAIVISDSTYDIPLFEYSENLKVLINSNGGKDFFAASGARRDETWIVVETPSLIERLAD